MCFECEQKKEHEEYLKKLKKLARDVKKDPKKGMQILVNAGIYDENGNLTAQYR